MKKYLAILVLASLVLGVSQASGSGNLSPDPSSIMRATEPSEIARGILFIENMDSIFSLGYIKYTPSPEKNSAGVQISAEERDWKICPSWTDDSCIKRYLNTIDGYVILGSCVNQTEIGCVESLGITDSSGNQRALKYLGPATSGVVDIPESLVYGVPRSSSRPLYQDENGQLYLVRASVRASFQPTGKNKAFLNLNVDVSPVQKIQDSKIEAPEAISLPNNVTGMGIVTVRPTLEECLAIDKGICYRSLYADLTTAYQLQVRVPTGVSGWMNGRLVDPKFTLSQLNAQSQIISVSAKPAKMPIAGGWATYSQLPADFLQNLYPYSRIIFDKKMPGFFISSPSQGDRGFTEYAAWAPYLKDKAITSVTNWSFSTQSNGGKDFCGKLPEKISGVVSSNASVYSSRPPTWDAVNATLSYQVASPHFDENGVENKGTYTLAISMDTIKCLYGQNGLPPSATISIGYGSDVVTVATVTLKSDSDWVYFSANGFHYSTPTIQVKFAKPAASPVPSATPTAKPAQQPLKIQWCAKGNAKKKVMAVNPVCPKGYKKIKAPL